MRHTVEQDLRVLRAANAASAFRAVGVKIIDADLEALIAAVLREAMNESMHARSHARSRIRVRGCTRPVATN